jgi:DNA-directed RNA polymerase specialized sigma24 family protein
MVVFLLAPPPDPDHSATHKSICLCASMAEELHLQLQLVRRMARKGARSATSSAPLVDLAVEATVNSFEDAILRKKAIGSLAAWTYRVARNAALRAAGRRGPRWTTNQRWDVGSIETDGDRGVLPRLPRQQLRRLLGSHRAALTPVQFRVLALLADGCSYHHAAKSLRMDRSNLKRTFRAALRRLRSRFPQIPC